MSEENFVETKARGRKENVNSKQGMKRATTSLWNSIKGFLGYILMTFDIVLCLALILCACMPRP